MANVVSLEGKRKGPGLDPLLSLCADDMARVDREILARMRSPVALIPELANHLIGAGGKRMRPLLTVAAARLCGYAGDDDRHVRLATCVEFIHSATLLHDDVVDVSALRRGKPTANTLWGDKASVLVGDFLFTRSFELMVEVGSLDILDVLSKASSTIAEGEVLQLVTQRDISTPEATYLEVIKAKTARLFNMPTKDLGALAQVGQPLVRDLVDVGALGPELAPPNAQAVDDTGPGTLAHAGLAAVAATVVENLHHAAVGNAARARVLRVNLEQRLGLDVAQALHIDETGVQEIARRR